MILTKNSFVDGIDGTRTRQKGRGNFVSRECQLKEPREDFWSRTAFSNTLFSKNVSLDEGSVIPVKEKLTAL